MDSVINLFLPESTLEEWALSDQADVREGRLVITGETEGFLVVPAVHFLRLVSGKDDGKLLAKVKTETQLAQLGAEQMMNSVIVGDAAYEVEAGYVAQLEA